MAIWTDWFDHAAEYLHELRELRADASPMRLWAEPFAMGVRLQLGEGRTVAVGLSAGDAHYAEPYWYVAPRPLTVAPDALPDCDGGGHWHTDEFTAAVLPAHDVHGYPEGQVRAFLIEAIGHAEALVGG